jgi:hypothetical protein
LTSIPWHPCIVGRLIFSLLTHLFSELMQTFPRRAIFQTLSSFSLSPLATFQSLHNILHLWAPRPNSLLMTDIGYRLRIISVKIFPL